jgi:hypothetical protein
MKRHHSDPSLIYHCIKPTGRRGLTSSRSAVFPRASHKVDRVSTTSYITTLARVSLGLHKARDVTYRLDTHLSAFRLDSCVVLR